MIENTNSIPVENQTPEPTAVFQEIENMTEETALDSLLSAIAYAQTKGIFALRDSVYLAKAISVLRPGTI